MDNTAFDSYVRNLIGDTTAPYFISSTDLTYLRDDIGRDFTRRTRRVRASSSASVTSGSASVTLPAACAEIIRVINSNGTELTPVHVSELGENWEATTGTPTNYVTGITGDDTLWLYPEPDANDTLTVYYYDQHVAGAELSVKVNARYHTALGAGVAAKALARSKNEADVLVRQNLWQEYEAAVAEARKEASRNFNSHPREIQYDNF